MTSRLLPSLAAVAALLLCVAAPAAASPTQESIIQDDTLLLERGAASQQAALDDIVALGGDTVRALVIWDRVAPDPSARRAPQGFDDANPAAYPASAWDPYDDLVRGAQARGLQVLFTPTGPIPRWATPCRGETAKAMRVCKPRAGAFGRFVRALATRYSGAYADENQDGAVLPRVARWSIWNEPNQPGWLFPQYERRGGRTLAFAAHRYRDLARAAVAAFRATGHGRDQILLGETAPLGTLTGQLARRRTPPVPFLRELFCLDARGRALRGTAARIRGCRKFRRIAVNGYAHHPYTTAAAASPASRTEPSWITISTASRLTRLLDRAAAARRIPRGLGVYYTEYGFQTSPPDRLLGVPLKTQARYLNWSDYIAFRNRRVKSVAQYKLNDDRDTGGFQTGLRFFDGRRKASWDAYRLPVFVTRSGSGARVYGQVRPLAAGATARVQIQWRRQSRGPWKTLSTRTVRSARGHFVAKVGRRAGEFRLRWRAGRLVSRTTEVQP